MFSEVVWSSHCSVGWSGIHFVQWGGLEFTLFSGVIWSSLSSAGCSRVYAVVLKTEWGYGVKTNGEVCRGFLVWLGVRASCYIRIGDKEFSLESEREKYSTNCIIIS